MARALLKYIAMSILRPLAAATLLALVGLVPANAFAQEPPAWLTHAVEAAQGGESSAQAKPVSENRPAEQAKPANRSSARKAHRAGGAVRHNPRAQSSVADNHQAPRERAAKPAARGSKTQSGTSRTASAALRGSNRR